MTVLIPEDEIRQRVDVVAGQIARAYAGQPLTIVGVLTGCLVFLADLIRRLDLHGHLAKLALSDAEIRRRLYQGHCVHQQTPNGGSAR